MEQIIMLYRNRGQHRTCETYETTLNSFRRFRDGTDIPLSEIDSGLLEDYQQHLMRLELSPNTISFYHKHLRAVYNRAVDEGLVADSRPFRRVSTSVEKTVKRAVPLNVIRRLKSMKLAPGSSDALARDIFLFSFYTRGMSFIDIAYLRKKDLCDGILRYRRQKTGQLLMMRWEPCMQGILDKHASVPSSPYLFSLIKDPSGDVRHQYQNALFLVNRHIKSLGRRLGLDQPLTLYCARHSWASIARENGIPVSVISEGMGHGSEKTTQIYLASLKTEVIDKANRKILRLL